MKIFRAAVIVIGLLFFNLNPDLIASTVADESSFAACQGEPSEGKKGKEVNKFSEYFTLALLVEAQGKGKFHPEYEPRGDLCLAGELSGGGKTARILYTPFEKGMQTLHYKVLMDDGGVEREFLVLYNGTASLIDGGFRFYVVEILEKETLYYALYKKQPDFKTIQRLFQDILDGKRAAHIRTYWPDDSDELLVGKGDGFNLK